MPSMMPSKPLSADPREPAQDAIAMLTLEHLAMRQILTTLDATTSAAPADRTALLGEVAGAIRSHARIEEKIFYPAFAAVAKLPDDRKLYYESIEDHDMVDRVLAECHAAIASSDIFASNVKVLKELVEHHVDREEKEMFPRVRALVTKATLQALANEMRALKVRMDDGLAAGAARLGPMEGQVAMRDSAIQQVAASSRRGAPTD